MASGDVVGIIKQVMPPAANFATVDTRAGGSTPAEATVVHDFDDTTVEYLDYLVQLAGYDGGGLTIDHEFAMTSATSGAVVFSDAIRRIVRDGEDLDASHTYDYNNSAATTVASAAGETVNAPVTFTDGADMDSWANGEYAIVRVRRVPTDGGDTASGDAELLGITIKET